MLACMCTDCDVNYKENKPQIQGEATEVAIVQNAFKLGFLKMIYIINFQESVKYHLIQQGK